MKNKTIAILLFLFAASVFFNTQKTYAYVYHSQQEAVAWARSQLGKGLDYDGIYGNQCVDLIKFYYKWLAGVETYGNGYDYKNNALPSGWVRVYSNFQPGDVAVWKTNHVGIIESADSVGFNAVNQNFDEPIDGAGVCKIIWFNNSVLDCAIRPDFTSSDTTPPTISNVRITDVTADGYTVTCNVSDNVGVTSMKYPSWNVDIHRGEDANWLSGNISGNQSSCRVNLSALKSGAVEGNYITHIYAYDAAGNKTCVPTSIVNIERTAPVIKSAKVIEMDSLGYVVEVEATDNKKIARVQCPTWTDHNGQDDIQKDWWTNPSATAASVGNNIYRYRVNVSEHNGEYGTYHTHVYVYDDCSNSSKATINKIMVNKDTMPKRIKTYNNIIYAAYEENCSWSDKVSFAGKTNSTLASITSEAEQSIITELIRGMYYSYYSIGGYRDGVGKPWKWLDGKEFSYTNWSPNQPDCAGNNEFYLTAINGTKKSGMWNDVPADYSLAGFITKTSAKLEPRASMEIGDSVYEFYEQKLPYNIAEEYARVNGGRLATIKNSVISEKISQKAKELKGYFYIGLTDREKEGTFVWSDGKKADYTNFAAGEPNNGGITVGNQNYGVIQPTGYWDDNNGYNEKIGFIVEYGKSETPTPTPDNSQSGSNSSIFSGSKSKVIPPKKSNADQQVDSAPTSDSKAYKTVSRSDLSIGLFVGEGGRKKATLYWSKNKHTEGYEIQISSNKIFKGKTQKYASKNKQKIKIKGLRSKRKYYVRIRAYYNGVYGKWKKTTVKVR